ncbi:MAG: galactose mutarotase [Dinoroseobacter sp.]|jgi:aldose 1-epimerase|nr:galactose mutarotase [Dinoroseobacter sp.]
MQIRRIGGPDDAPLIEAELQDGDVRLSLLNLGVVTRGWWVPCGGASVPVILGYASPRAYLTDDCYLGAIVGRVANRTSGGRLQIDDTSHQLSQNEGQTHVHGGLRGLSRRHWQVEGDSAANAIRFTYRSPDGEEGYPGLVDFAVTVTLRGTCVRYDMAATADRLTPVNLAQHNYYNLMGGGEVWSHHLTCIADRRTPVDGRGLPTGEILPVDGSRYDFRDTTALGAMDPTREGMDVNVIFPEARDPDAPVAQLGAPNGLRLKMWSDQPGAQLYTAKHLTARAGGWTDKSLWPFHGLCIEPQAPPDALNQPGFPSILIDPDRPYRQCLRVDIAEASCAG